MACIPEGVPSLGLVAEVGGSRCGDGVGGVRFPAHTCLFHAHVDHRFARHLDRSAADPPAVGPIGGIVHAVDVVTESARFLPPPLLELRTTNWFWQAASVPPTLHNLLAASSSHTHGQRRLACFFLGMQRAGQLGQVLVTGIQAVS